jgi:hypothetical protein
MGYGRVWVPGPRQESCHRVSYELSVGAIPDGAQVLHRCDVPLCVNPDHLFVGTHADNMNDRDAKGRTPRGEQSGRARLTENIIREVKKRRCAGESVTEIARDLGVPRGLLYSAVNGHTWRHVP